MIKVQDDSPPVTPNRRLAVDIGGTFTDVVVFDENGGRLNFGKNLTTPRAMVEGIAAGVAKASTTFAECNLFVHGSTIAINSLLERTGARTALVTTRGFRDIYEIGRINRPDAYNLFFKKHEPLVPRRLRFEISERLSADGEVIQPLDEAQLHSLADTLDKEGIGAVAILFLHSYRNPQHEIRAREILSDRLPRAFISCSYELSQEYREFERCSTVVANAFVGPRVGRYLAQIEQRVDDEGFKGSLLIVQSTGGLFDVSLAKTECIRILESGPAGGVIGAHAVCHARGLENAIAFDMGGTTAKAGVILNGRVLTKGDARIGAYATALPVQIPTIDIFEVGTGGGSIARVQHGAIHLGPDSAGADPGPACYGRGGTQPTITDANLVLGRLGADRFLGGEMTLDTAAAEEAIKRWVAEPLGLTVAAAADGILRIAATKMSYAVKGVTMERGLDAGMFILVSYGGAGPLHATAVARELGIRQVLVPRAPGHFSAFGMLFSDLRYDFARTRIAKLSDLDFTEMESAFLTLEQEGRTALTNSTVQPREVIVARAFDMRYVGQEHLVTVDIPLSHFESQNRVAIKALFDSVHEQRYGTSAPAESAEIASLRTTVTGLIPKPALNEIKSGGRKTAKAAETGSRRSSFDGIDFQDTRTYKRDELLSGNIIEGPCLIEEQASTTVVFPQDRVTVDRHGNLLIEIGANLQ